MKRKIKGRRERERVRQVSHFPTADKSFSSGLENFINQRKGKEGPASDEQKTHADQNTG